MSFPKFLLGFTALLFGTILVISLFKDGKKQDADQPIVMENVPTETLLDDYIVEAVEERKESAIASKQIVARVEEGNLPDADRVEELFTVGSSTLSIVETISYTSRVPWIKGRPAWVADYATHFATSRYFISRSLTGKKDYFSHAIANGNRFNVFRQDKDFEFHLVIDINRLKMWFYYFDKDTDQRVLLKTYFVGLGRKDEKQASGSLTPLGTYLLSTLHQ